MKGLVFLSWIPAPPVLLFGIHLRPPGTTVVSSDFIGSPGVAGDHLDFFSHRIGSPGAAGDDLGIPSASRLLGFHHLGFPSHHKPRWVSVAPPAPPDLDLGISASPLAPPALGGSWFSLRTRSRPLDLHLVLGISISVSRSPPRSRHLDLDLELQLSVLRRQWVSVAPPAPPGLTVPLNLSVLSPSR
uniref:Uncharacterized protein n=1 Tax=Fagus sylvatica TaxID=28930 RepID=A0A2N9G5Q9_FAGSY